MRTNSRRTRNIRTLTITAAALLLSAPAIAMSPEGESSG